MAATAILTTKIAEAAVIIVAEFIVAVPSSEAEPSSEVALLSEAEQDIEEPTLLTIAPAGAVANLWEPGTVGKIEMSALGLPVKKSEVLSRSRGVRSTPHNGHRSGMSQTRLFRKAVT